MHGDYIELSIDKELSYYYHRNIPLKDEIRALTDCSMALGRALNILNVSSALNRRYRSQKS